MQYPDQVPPLYAPPAPPQPNKNLWIFLVIGACGCVFVIIPILAAILFPVFSQAREKAREASCMSNVKQSSLAVIMYA